MLLTANRKQLVHHVSHGLSDRYLKKGPVKADVIINEVLQGMPVVVLDATEDPRVQYREQAREEGIASIVSVPVTLREEVTGVLRLYTAEPCQFSEEDLDFLCAATNLGAIALEKAFFYESCQVDLERVSQERAKLEEEKQRFARFLAFAAHELKAPLSAIESYFGVLLGGFAGELNDRQRKMLDRSSQRINGLLELISDLLDIPRIEMGQITGEMKEIPFSQVIEGCLDGVCDMASAKGVELSLQVPQSAHTIYGSDIRLKQALCNLVSNAINYTHEGTVTVKVEDMDNDVRVEVVDTGIGIPPQDLPSVFDDFFRASNVKAGGTGLGLSIAKRIVEAHGGKIWVESPCSETGKGSKFTLTLPRRLEHKD
jgi:signal transduction histidine kinase